MSAEKITYFGETDFRNKATRFGIKDRDRLQHMYIIGKTGLGKSTLLENLAAQDINNGEGFIFMDPHGSAIDKLIEYIPEHRIKDVIYFAPFDVENPISFNVLEDVGSDKRHLVVSGLIGTFKKIWQDAWSARMEYILTNTLLALLEYPDATLLHVNRMYSDKEFRKDVVSHITDAAVKSFWVDEYANYTDRFAQEATPAIQNKIGQFTSNPLIRNIIGQAKTSFNIREIMDNKKILLINLSKGRIGETNAGLLGGMLITKIYLAAMSRADVGVADLENLANCFFYVDEFQNFASESFADILSEARKYKLGLIIAHQYVEQMTEEVKDAVLGNVGTMVTFRVGALDADVFEKEFANVFSADDFVNLGFAQIYLRLMIDRVGSKPFSARTLPPIELPKASNKDAVIKYSRTKYSSPKVVVEKNVVDSFSWKKVSKKNSKKLDKKHVEKKKEETTVYFKPKNKKITKKNDLKDLDTSQRLKNLISSLEDDKKANQDKEQIKKSNNRKLVDYRPKKKLEKNASEDNRLSLKDVISRAMDGEKKEYKKKKINEIEKVEIKKIKKGKLDLTKINTQNQKSNQDANNSKTLKEIPEDVLRRILR